MVWTEVDMNTDGAERKLRLPKDLTGLSRERLMEWKLQVDDSISVIKNQIAEAKARAYDEGVYADRDWFSRATRALQHRKRDSQRIQFEFSRRKREDKRSDTLMHAVEHREFAEDFMVSAKEILSQSLYDRVIERTKDIRLVRRLDDEREVAESGGEAEVDVS